MYTNYLFIRLQSGNERIFEKSCKTDAFSYPIPSTFNMDPNNSDSWKITLEIMRKQILYWEFGDGNVGCLNVLF